MAGGRGMGAHGQGPGPGRGMRVDGQKSAPGSGNADWLAHTVGTLVLALGALVFRALTRKMTVSAEQADGKGGQQNADNK